MRLTRQQIYDKAVNGLAAQGFELAIAGETCAYRTESGRKCAAGQLIPDEAYKPLLDSGGGLTVAYLRGLESCSYPQPAAKVQALRDGLAAGGVSEEDYDLVSELQKAHDGCIGEADFKPALITVGRANRLDIPGVLTC